MTVTDADRSLNKIVGRRVRHRRKELGWTLDVLMAESGLTKAFLSDLENGKRGIGVASLKRIADAMGRSLEWFTKSFDYGVCPFCKGEVLCRERRLGGNDKCENGHVYPSKESVKT